jgi:hypothetical protein
MTQPKGTSAEQSNAQVDAASKQQRTDETVQRAVRHGVFAPQLSTQNLLQILAQSALSIIGAIDIFLDI